jgi:hypothetical protein
MMVNFIYNSILNKPHVIDAVIREYKVSRLAPTLNIVYNDINQGNHYDYMLK